MRAAAKSAAVTALLVFLAGGCGDGAKGPKGGGDRQLPDLKPLPLPAGMGRVDKTPPKAEPAPGNAKAVGGPGVE